MTAKEKMNEIKKAMPKLNDLQAFDIMLMVDWALQNQLFLQSAYENYLDNSDDDDDMTFSAFQSKMWRAVGIIEMANLN